MPYHYTDALINDVYPSEANVDISRSALTISDLAACWPDVPSILKGKPAETYKILVRDSLNRKAIPYAEIEDNFDNASWWCNNIISIVNILRSIPSKENKKPRRLETKFLDFLNAWKLERFVIDNCGGEPADPQNPPKFCPECGDLFDDRDIKA